VALKEFIINIFNSESLETDSKNTELSKIDDLIFFLGSLFYPKRMK